MKSFEEIWDLTDTIPGSFTRLSGEKLFEYAMAVQPEEYMVEIGVDQGRSSSILLNACEENEFIAILIDKWESVLIDNMAKVKNLTKFFPCANADIWNMPSTLAAEHFTDDIALLHIDGHHHDDVPDGGPELDCALWLPKVKRGGIACLHDVGGTFPDVDRAVKNHLSDWEPLGIWDSLGIWRRP